MNNNNKRIDNLERQRIGDIENKIKTIEGYNIKKVEDYMVTNTKRIEQLEDPAKLNDLMKNIMRIDDTIVSSNRRLATIENEHLEKIDTGMKDIEEKVGATT